MERTFWEQIEQTLDAENYLETVALLETIEVGRLDGKDLTQLRAYFLRIPNQYGRQSYRHCMQEMLLSRMLGDAARAQRWFHFLLSLREGCKEGTHRRALLENCISYASLLKAGIDNGQLLLTISILYNELIDSQPPFYLSATARRPSVLRGASDLSEWGKNYRAVSSIVRPMLGSVLRDHGKGAADAAIAELHYLKNNLNEACLAVAGAISAGDPEIRFAGLAILAKIYAQDPTAKTPGEVLTHIGQMLSAQNAGWLLPNYRALCADDAIREGRIEEIKAWLEEPGSSEMDACCPLNSYEMLTRLHAFLALGRYREATTLSENLLLMLEGEFRPLDRMEFLMDGAIACLLLGSSDLAFDKIEQALKLAYSYGYIRLFADKGEQMFRLLTAYAKARNVPEYLTRLLKTILEEAKKYSFLYPALFSPPTDEQGGVPELTQAEMQILHRISDGDTNRQIAQELNITVSTVKFHIHNLFEKLEVNSRTQAVHAAKRKKLLS